MNKNKIFLISTFALAVLVFGALVFWSKSSSKDPKTADSVVESSRFIKPHSPIKGSPDAKVTVVEFLDPECEACRAMHPIVKGLLAEYEGKIKLVIRYMPLHGNSKLAAAHLEEAREQGKYDQALDILFARQPEWADHGQPRPELLPNLLSEIGIDTATLETSALLSKHGWKIDLDQADGAALGVRLTPTFFVNGEMLNDIGYAPLKLAIDKHL